MKQFIKDVKWFFDFSDFEEVDILGALAMAVLMPLWVIVLFIIFS